MSRISRRQVILAAGALAAAPLAHAQAQQQGKVPRIGILLPGPLGPRKHQWDIFQQTLHQLGYTDGKNVVLEFRTAPKEGDPLENLAADLVRLKADVIVAVGDRAIQAARAATRTIPIVMCPSQDAVAQGFVASLARPGGNITGISILNPDLTAKRLQILKELVPKLARVAVLWSPPDVAFRKAELVAPTMNMEVVNLKVSGTDDLDKAFELAVQSSAGALLVAGGPALFGLRVRIAELAQRYRLPAICHLPPFAYAGGLIMYGPSDYCAIPAAQRRRTLRARTRK